MLKVLHTYTKDDRQTARYLSLLTNAMQGRTEMAVCDEKADFQRLCAEMKPDIIHQHGQQAMSRPAGSRYVITANGFLSLGCDAHNYYAVIARSQIEANRLKMPRTEIIRNPLVTKTTDFDETAEKLMHVYRKVMDSHPLELLDTPVRHLLAAALKVGLLGDSRWVSAFSTPLPPDSAAAMPREANASLAFEPLSERSSHLLHIYVTLEGVADIVNEGLRLLHQPLLPADVIDNYLPEGYTRPVSMRGGSMMEMLTDISQNGLSLLRLSDMLLTLYDPHSDEHELLQKLESLNFKPLFQSILQILHEQLLLDEGYMPCPPVDNRRTEHLRNLLFNHLKL